MVKEKELNKLFFRVFNKIINDKNFSDELSRSIKLLAKPDATFKIVEQIKRRLQNGNKL